jgi:hypothetical protein
MVVALHSSIHNGGISLLPNAFLGYFMVNPLGVTPHAIVDFAELHGGARIVLYGFLEMVVEIAIIQEHEWIVKPSIEVSLNRLE